MSIANIGKIIDQKMRTDPSFLETPESDERASKEQTELFSALFKYLEETHKQTMGVLKVMNHNQREILSRIEKLEK